MTPVDGTWAWQCSRCARFVHDRHVQRDKDGTAHHWDVFLELWCGPVTKVNLR